MRPALVGLLVAFALPAGASAKACSSAYTHAMIGGTQKCLHTGEFCAKAEKAQYVKYGFACQLVDGTYRLEAKRKPLSITDAAGAIESEVYGAYASAVGQGEVDTNGCVRISATAVHCDYVVIIVPDPSTALQAGENGETLSQLMAEDQLSGSGTARLTNAGTVVASATVPS